MPDPAELLAVARLLSDPATTSPLGDAHLRRAVSTAYYAVFHTVLRAASDRFIGAGQEASAGYLLLYRGFNHEHMKTVCEALQISTLKDRHKQSLRRSKVSQAMRDFASIFPSLQDWRHAADYDPAATFEPSNVASIIDSAAFAIEAFNSVVDDEKTDILALLLVRARPPTIPLPEP